MIYGKAEIKDGEVVVFNSKAIDQTQLTSDCWLVQFDGLVACNSCELRETEDCGGGETLERMRREVRDGKGRSC